MPWELMGQEARGIAAAALGLDIPQNLQKTPPVRFDPPMCLPIKSREAYARLVELFPDHEERYKPELEFRRIAAMMPFPLLPPEKRRSLFYALVRYVLGDMQGDRAEAQAVWLSFQWLDWCCKEG